MTDESRADLGFGDALAGLSDFKPAKKRATKADTLTVAEQSGFKSREPRREPVQKEQRRRRTGRNAQINIKTTPETIEKIYQIADQKGWGIGETLERAIKALEMDPE